MYAAWDREDGGEAMPYVWDLMRDIGHPTDDWDLTLRVTDPRRADGLITGVTTDQHGLVKVSLTGNGHPLAEANG